MVIAGKMHSQSPILKTKGALSNPIILTYLWEQSCILHTLTKYSSMLEEWQPVLALAGLAFDIAGS